MNAVFDGMAVFMGPRASRIPTGSKILISIISHPFALEKFLIHSYSADMCLQYWVQNEYRFC